MDEFVTTFQRNQAKSKAKPKKEKSIPQFDIVEEESIIEPVKQSKKSKKLAPTLVLAEETPPLEIELPIKQTKKRRPSTTILIPKTKKTQTKKAQN